MKFGKRGNQGSTLSNICILAPADEGRSRSDANLPCTASSRRAAGTEQRRGRRDRSGAAGGAVRRRGRQGGLEPGEGPARRSRRLQPAGYRTGEVTGRSGATRLAARCSLTLGRPHPDGRLLGC